MNIQRCDHDNPEHARWVLVDWTLGTTCNYRCSYCHPSLHDGKYGFREPKQVLDFARVLKSHYLMSDRSIFVQFTGGEVSLYPDLPEVAAELAAMGIRCGIISNGSRGLDFWRSLSPTLHSIVLSHHIEFAKLDHFATIAQFLSEQIRTHIHVTMLPLRFEQCLERAYAIRAACPRATISLKALRVEFGIDLYTYTPEQLAILQASPIPPPRNPLPGGIRGLMRFQDGDATQTFSASRILASGRNQWQGWSCSAGLELLAIRANGDVYRGLCRVGGCLGNISGSVALPFEEIVCERSRCNCLADIMTTKVLALAN